MRSLGACDPDPVLLTGIAFSAWPDGLAEVWPSWRSELALGFVFACAAAAWHCLAILARLRADNVTPTTTVVKSTSGTWVARQARSTTLPPAGDGPQLSPRVRPVLGSHRLVGKSRRARGSGWGDSNSARRPGMSPARGRGGLLTRASLNRGGLESDSGILHRESAITHTTPRIRDLHREVVRDHDRFGS